MELAKLVNNYRKEGETLTTSYTLKKGDCRT